MTQVLPGFGVVSSFTPNGDDALAPQATLYTVPHHSPVNTPVTILWDTLNVAFITITGNNGFDPPFSLGPISVSGAGVYVWNPGWTHSITLLLTAFDINHVPLGLTATTTVIIP